MILIFIISLILFLYELTRTLYAVMIDTQAKLFVYPYDIKNKYMYMLFVLFSCLNTHLQLTSVQQCATGKFHPRYYNDGKTFFISQSLMLKSFVGALISSNCHQFSIWIEKRRFDLNCIIAYYFSIQKHSNIRINNYDVKNVSFNHFKGIDMDGNVILFISLMLRLLCFRFYITHFFFCLWICINFTQLCTLLCSFLWIQTEIANI